MAIFQLGTVVTDIRGKIAGQQFNKTRAGHILQKKCIQRKGATSQQSNKRASFSRLARFWRTLTGAQQSANNANAVNYPVTDRFGNVKILTGFQLLLRSNINRETLGLPPITVVPASPPQGVTLINEDPGISASVCGFPTFFMFWNFDGPGDTGYTTVFYLSEGVSPGVENYTGKYFFYGSADTGGETFDPNCVDLPQIPTWVSGRKIFAKAITIHNASGVAVATQIITVLVP